MSSWFEKVKSTGQNAVNMVNSNSHVLAVQERAAKLTEGVSGRYSVRLWPVFMQLPPQKECFTVVPIYAEALKNSPAAIVTQQVGEKTDQMKSLITGQHKVRLNLRCTASYIHLPQGFYRICF